MDNSTGSSRRAILAVAIVVAFAAGVLVGYLVGARSGAGAAPVPDTVYRVDVGDAPTLGPDDAPVTVVIFTDLRCPACRGAAPELGKLHEKHGDDVRIVFKNMPLTALHPEAPMVHEAAMAAAAQGKFWEFHDEAFAFEGRMMSRADVDAIAARVGLDTKRFAADMDAHTYQKHVQDDMKQGKALGINGTPTLYVNGRKMVGLDPRKLERIVQYELANVAFLVERGLSPDQAYEHIMKTQAIELAAQARPEKPAAPEPPPRVEDPEAVYRVDVADSAVLGEKNAPVTVVVFVDYQCAFSAKASATVARLLEEHAGEVRVVFKNNPQPRHGGAMLAAEAALAAGAQGKFRGMHDKLFENRGKQSRADIETYATELGLDMQAFEQALDSHEHAATIHSEQKLARRLGATSTPTYFVNGKKMPGNQPYESIESAVAAAKAGAQKLVDLGVPAGAVYEVLTHGAATSVKYLPSGAASMPKPPRPPVPENVPY